MSLNLITPSIVHKNFAEDVLITDGHFLIPTKIKKKDIEKIYESKKDTIHRFYIGNDEELFLKGIYEFDNDGLVSSSVIYDELPDFQKAEGFSKGINYYDYVKNVKKDYEALKLDDFVEIFLVLKDSFDFTAEFYSTMYIDTNNYYFYRKHHEHVPGVMLIEAARQAMYAQMYQSNEVIPGTASVSIDSLNTRFFYYVNAHYPVYISVKHVEPIAGKKIDKIAEFYQEGKLVAEVTLSGPIIPLRAFNRLTQAKISDSQYFIPIKNIASTIFLTNSQDKLIEANLRALSLNNFVVDIPIKEKLEDSEELKSTLFVESLGYICCEMKVIDSEDIGANQKTTLAVENISSRCQKKLNSAIKNFTLIDESNYQGGPYIHE